MQNYALQQALGLLDFHATTLVVVRHSDTIKKTLKALLGRIPLPLNRLSNWKMLSKKRVPFGRFSNKYIDQRFVYDLKSASEDYDYIVVGSDQVWNPHFIGYNNTNFLNFSPKKKRVSYAASFGVSEIPASQKDFFAKNLKSISKISVREESGVEIVKRLAGKNAELVPDPTMLLSREDWNKRLKTKDKPLDNNYIFVYFLRTPDDAVLIQIKELAKREKLDIYTVMGDYYKKEHAVPDPLEFVNGIKHANYVFTDSFHASVFSIIMKTPFKVYARKDMKMSSRLETILGRYKMNVAKEEGVVSRADYDFEYSDSIMKQERTKGFDFLKRVLGRR